jgi:hypothetical protein
MTAFGAAALEYIAAGFGLHPFAEAVIVFAFAVRWLKCSFHIALNKKLILQSKSILQYKDKDWGVKGKRLIFWETKGRNYAPLNEKRY